MTLDSALLYRPTDSLILPDRRRFFPFKIPNSHHQLRHYISTSDPDRIYVAVGRIIYTIHISSRKREIITVIPFEPKCLTAGLGWIGIGGSENGDCAFIKLGDSGITSPRTRAAALDADIDSPLPLDLDPPLRRLPPRAPEVIVQEFGGSIVNSVTLHRLPAPREGLDHEDVAVLSNNDKTVSIFSLTRQEMLETIRHPICMNYAIISPDSKVLAAVGDANQIWFYHVRPITDEHGPVQDGDKLLSEWKWPLIKKVDLDSDPHYDDQCCFTIAFSPCSSLCAVGSQGGIITIFDMNSILNVDLEGYKAGEEVLCVFRSSRSFFDGGAVRCMTFSPRPWDLLVWVEDHGRVGVADIRQAFSRRQILNLDMEEEGLERIRTQNLDKIDDGEGSEPESENEPSRDPTRSPEDARGTGRMFRRRMHESQQDSQTMREELARDLTARERQIIDFLNTARWASSIEEGPQRAPRYASPLPGSGSSPPRGSRHSPLSSSPPDHFPRHEHIRDRNLERTRIGEPRRRSSVVLSQDSSSSHSQPNPPNSALIPHPTITLRWTASPSQLPPSDSPFETTPSNSATTSSAIHVNGRANSGSNGHEGTSEIAIPRARVLFDRSLGVSTSNGSGQRQRGLRSRSIPRRSERPPGATAEVQDSPGGPNAETRTNLAAERLRLQRRAAIEESQRLNQWEQQYRRLMEFDQLRNNPRFRSLRGDFSDRPNREEMGVGTAGVGWGEDGRTL
ncbi:hypothetical protein CPC735_073190 [Coccidioides posadasii C735 delta SOWgp]|uniref:DUF2415 domain-containing protein n=1 Tax=Coccidioides posadasii (strain C735) TaxID=222929 RepID=C5P1S9_COCP7|nr:hypothetical protein CPC735_073190 [Coccidioides posadasii C735 delta SOWgp]EER29637.1 hypothetical protein CPC735_073190 [Coccidioides posadasii C735 delta SOWgp]|eukprot:XP_003071782.1 hypothetical protein CPC735_073190 [Coccidioides posadasii C735 delta SOWgp]